MDTLLVNQSSNENGVERLLHEKIFQTFRNTLIYSPCSFVRWLLTAKHFCSSKWGVTFYLIEHLLHIFYRLMPMKMYNASLHIILFFLEFVDTVYFPHCEVALRPSRKFWENKRNLFGFRSNLMNISLMEIIYITIYHLFHG